MSSKLPESYLFGFRPDRPNDPAIEKAIRTIERDPELKRRLDEQAEFDRQVARTIHAIAPPAGLREMLGSANGRSPVKGKRFVIPLLAAVICGVSILIGLMVVFAIDRHDRTAVLERFDQRRLDQQRDPVGPFRIGEVVD